MKFSSGFARLLAVAALAASALGAAVPAFTLQESRASAPYAFTEVGAAPEDYVLTMRINLAMSDRSGLESKLMQAATPGSPTFRQWLSKEQVEAFAKPAPQTTQAVMDWLTSYGIAATPVTPAGDWLTFDVPVGKANALLNAQYAIFRHTDSGAESVRTLAYSLPADLVGLVKAVHPTTSFAGPLRGPPVVPVSPPSPGGDAPAPSNCSSGITPACLQDIYNIPTTPIKTTNSTLAVSGFIEENANLVDLKAFLEKFRPDMDSNTTFSVTLIDDAENSQEPEDAGLEANLDIQYTVGLANGIPTAFVDVGDANQDGDDLGFLDLINALIAEKNPPLVISTSYGLATEASLSESLTVALCDQYMQLTARGVSVMFASGDGGVASTPGEQCNGTAFPPTFSTCPFATLVGATENVSPEKGAELSAGGFSNYFAQPSWQSSAVSSYLTKLGNTNAGLFNRSGRAYPDVSAQGVNVQVIVDGQTGGVEGTSCSSPIFASVIALINDKLLAAGKPPLGFLNPWLYANPQAFNDVTTGNNPGCGTQGFPALEGWDPITGLGTPNYPAMLEAALES